METGESCKVAVMQPYLLPYFGYFQLVSAVDVFVLYDDAQFSKGGWTNRNRLHYGGGYAWFTLPVRSESWRGSIGEAGLVESAYAGWRRKFFRTLEQNYASFPYLEEAVGLAEETFPPDSVEFGKMLRLSIEGVARRLGIQTEIRSTVELDLAGASRDEKLYLICEWIGAEAFVNPANGIPLYSPVEFEKRGIELVSFSANLDGLGLVHPDTSVIDVMARVGCTDMRKRLGDGELRRVFSGAA